MERERYNAAMHGMHNNSGDESDPLLRYSGGGLGSRPSAHIARSTQTPTQPFPGLPEEREKKASKLSRVAMRDAIVIGAGPAGGTAALLLARAGWNVTIVEQHRFPRDKVCGESLGAMGVEVLDRLGLLEPLLQRGATRIRKANIYC